MLRRCIIAKPGHVLVEADAAAIEAVLMGFLCNDPTLIRIAKAGVHGYFMSHILKQPLDPNMEFTALQKACKAFKRQDPALYEVCKRTIHATHYGMTPYGMNDEYEEEFPTRAVAEEFQNAYLDTVATKLRATIQGLRERASKETFLDNHYQYRHHFFDVFSWDSKYNRWTLGGDAKRCVAFVPQSDASAIQTEDLIDLDAYEPELVAPWLRLIIHDSFVCEVPESIAQPCAQAMGRMMLRGRPELAGLSIGVEVKMGHSLAPTDMSEVLIAAA